MGFPSGSAGNESACNAGDLGSIPGLGRSLAPWKKSCDQPRQCIKKQRHYFANKCPYSQSYGFSSGHVQMEELDHKEG